MLKRKISIKELCNSIMVITEILGAEDRYVTMPSPIDDANEHSISFCSKRGEDALELIRNSKARVIICSKELAFSEEDYSDKTLILVSNPRLAFIQVMQKHFQEKIEFGIHPTVIIGKAAKIHPNVYIGPNTCIMGKCKISENTIVYGNVYIYPNVKIGKNVIIYAGTVIGADGFSYERNKKGELEKFPHVGGVIIEDDVEIGSNTSIDRGTLGNTIIGQGTKINKLCHIGHNVIIGKCCMINVHTSVLGSCRIGDYSWIAPCACIRDGIEIGRNAVIGMGSVVTIDVAPGQRVTGNFAIDHDKFIAFIKSIR